MSSVSSSDRSDFNQKHPHFFSFRSYRLVICILLLIANYMGASNRMIMSTAIICMVNSTITTDGNSSSSVPQGCVNSDSMMAFQDDLAIEGRMNWSPSEQSLILSASFYGGCLTVLFSGTLADRFGPDIIIAVVFLCTAILTLLTPLFAATSFLVVLISRVLMGVGESFFVPSINCMAARWFPAEDKTIAAAVYTTGFQFAAGFASLISASICRSTFMGGWPTIFYIFGSTSIVFVLVWGVMARGGPSRNSFVCTKERKYLESSIKIKDKKSPLSTPFSRILLSAPVHSIMLCNFAFSYSTSTMQAYLPLFLRELGLPIETIGWYTLTPFLFQIIGKMIIGPIIDYSIKHDISTLTMTTKIAQSMGSFGASIALIALAIFPSCTNSSIAIYILILYGLVYSGGTCGFYTSMLSISPENTGTLSSLAMISRLAASLISSSIVNALVAGGTVFKWKFIFGSAAIIQSLGGLHYFLYGTTEVQDWSFNGATQP